MLSDVPEVRAIEAFEFDDPCAADRFSRKLARENGWSLAYADRVVREYKRFIALAVTSPQPVTPSDQVDQAWHLHLQDTANYSQFCEEILGRPLLHTPSRGGAAERAQFLVAYEETLQRYRDTFDEPPPADIWPPVERRFGADLCNQRVNVAENWVIPKPASLLPRLSPRSGTARWAAALVALVVLSVAVEALLLRELAGARLFVLLVMGWLLALLIPGLHGPRPEERAELLAAMTPVRAAYLRAGPRRALECGLTKLLCEGVLEYEPVTRTLKVVTGLAATADLVERRIHAEVKRRGAVPIEPLLARARDVTRELRCELEGHGLLKVHQPLALFIASLFPGIALARAVDHPGAATPLPWLLLAVFMGLLAVRRFRPAGGRTDAGNQLLSQLQRAHPKAAAGAANAALVAPAAIAFGIGLYGSGVLAQPELAAWGGELASQPATDTVASDPTDTGAACAGGSDGGDGDGAGGCGGCGGGGD